MANIPAYEHKVHYYETDQMRIVHHSNYIRWFEEARVDFLEKIGFGYARMEEEGIVSPVLGVTCEYKSMTRFGDTVQVLTKIERFTGVKLNLSYQIVDASTGELRAFGESRHCFLDSRGVPVSLKKAHPEIFEVLSAAMQDDES